MRRGLMVVLALAISACLLAVPSQATSSQRYALPVESYAPYQPQRTCARKDKPGTVALGRWLVARGGVYGGTLRSCGSGGQSEHKDGRAFDWMLDAKDPDDSAVADAFLVEAFADDELGDTDALARRMGIMYVIWNDRMYAAWDGFEPKKYLSSGCRTRRTCSVTLRHRDHMHISLSRAGAMGRTSWYVEQAFAVPVV
ncbi:hypothetical protein [Nocardioides sp. Soil777]|uniref:hypothetical protein n=1 Tax=Nocardioides sp. Soil777 TaxID=1736409 RepID=UPI000ADA5D7B|nr:hypothetical protein [Nocardioides sp. Soil777]